MVIVDTDLIIGVLRGNADAVTAFRTLKDPCITSITAFELLRGVYMSRDPVKERTRILEAIGHLFVIDFSYLDADMAGRVDVYLTRSGLMIGTLDTMIAGICLTTKLPIITRNKKHFSKIKGLDVRSW